MDTNIFVLPVTALDGIDLQQINPVLLPYEF